MSLWVCYAEMSQKTALFYKNIIRNAKLKILWSSTIGNILILYLRIFFQFFFNFFFSKFFFIICFLKGLCIEVLGGRIDTLPIFWRACPVSAGPALCLRVFFYKNIIRNNKLKKLTSEDFFNFFFSKFFFQNFFFQFFFSKIKI